MATSGDHPYATAIANEMAYSSASRGTGIAYRPPEYVMKKMDEGLAVIAVNADNGAWAGFCCIEVWQHKKYVANSGLIVPPAYRGTGISKEIKIALFDHCRSKFPDARLFSLSASPAVIHMNKAMGYKIIPFAEVVNDELFLTGCESWVNYRDIMSREAAPLPYVAMVFDPGAESFEPLRPCSSQYILNETSYTVAM
ncbi:GNAT family N-acetyltransferase [Agriterribacter sp.]|uniref:GNAT family N-acetyltransferase n=1 Tax=Agriterribacter sp. TaxID=2821509 RepID=UPI002C659746|nr:GNAT family N-acetyltransferase [Agriterribacter sp.]HRP56167.1 GNAT family N-acetyltransferase [Agriterribacter sp.]